MGKRKDPVIGDEHFYEFGHIRGRAGCGVVSGVGKEYGILSPSNGLEGCVDGFLFMESLGLEAEFILFGPDKVCQPQGLCICQLLVFSNHINGYGAVRVVGPGEAHQIGGGHDALLFLGLTEFIDQCDHGLHSGGGLFSCNEDGDPYPGRFCLNAVV